MQMLIIVQLASLISGHSETLPNGIVIPSDWPPQINELIVPRAHLSLNGREDKLTPPRGVERVRDHLAPLYAACGRAEDCRIELFDCGHKELPEMRELVLAWLDRHLVGKA